MSTFFPPRGSQGYEYRTPFYAEGGLSIHNPLSRGRGGADLIIENRGVKIGPKEIQYLA
jgi:hypothetical protein